MSGVGEAALVIGLISAIITVIDTLSQAYKDSKDASGLPQAFRDVASKLPLVSETLGTVQQRMDASNPEQQLYSALKPVVEDCKSKVERLEKIFEKVLPPASSSRFDRYVAAVKAYGKGNMVEDLTKGILRDVQLLSENHGVKAATETQVGELAKAIQDLSSIPPSVPQRVWGELYGAHHYGSGAQNIHTGEGDINANSGLGSQYIGKTMYFGKGF